MREKAVKALEQYEAQCLVRNSKVKVDLGEGCVLTIRRVTDKRIFYNYSNPKLVYHYPSPELQSLYIDRETAELVLDGMFAGTDVLNLVKMRIDARKAMSLIKDSLEFLKDIKKNIDSNFEDDIGLFDSYEVVFTYGSYLSIELQGFYDYLQDMDFETLPKIKAQDM